MTDTHAVNWFDIQVKDLDASRKFYSTVLGAELATVPDRDTMVLFPYINNGVGGSLSHNPEVAPGSRSVVVYLNGGEDLQPMLDRVEGAGGKIKMHKTSIGSDGFMAEFEDLEGNVVGLHSLA